jgi:superfamily I DNA and/or RNA helicase
MTITIIVLLAIILLVLAAILYVLKKRPLPQKLESPKIEMPKIEFPEFPKIEFPKIEIPPAKEISLDLNPIVEALKNVSPPATNITAELVQNLANTQSDLIKVLQESSTMMRVNQAEFQSGLEAFHKAVDKLLVQIPNGEKELDAQKEFMQKFEDTFARVQEKASEAMSENSLRLQEILTEFLSKEAK